jgi:hypothetical protein
MRLTLQVQHRERPAQHRWRAVNSAHLVALVRAGATFKNGVLVERPDESASGDTHAHDTLIHRF